MQISTGTSACVDANIVLSLVLDSPLSHAAARIWRQLHEAGAHPIAPGLLYYEITNVLHRHVVQNLLLPTEASAALDVVRGFDITLYNLPELHQQALAIAQRVGLSAAYDAHYLALAERLSADFWTADRKLYRAAHELFPSVHLVE